MVNKKSQIKMAETIAILFIFFVLLMFGFIFYARVQRGEYLQRIQEITVLKGIQIAEKVSFFPEIRCSFDNVPTEDCIDLYKLTSASGNINKNKLFYYGIFEYSRVIIDQIYPNETQKTWTLYDNPKPNYADLINTPIPLNVYDPTTDTFSYAIMTVGVYR
jgi:hypothetical protein